MSLLPEILIWGFLRRSGNLRKLTGIWQQEFLVINGFITYDFFDEFTDPFIFVEIIDLIPGFDREDAEGLVGGSADLIGKTFAITDRWQTKFNATVRIEE
jgi:hypothetical protein